MLVLKADNAHAFLDYAMQSPCHRVIITWNWREHRRRTWEITPSENPNRPAYRLTFRLPEMFSRWVFGTFKGIQKRAWQTKEACFFDITIYRHLDERDYLFRLEFDRKETEAHLVAQEPKQNRK
jgi:hypothetical protein